MFATRVQGKKSHEVLWAAELLAAAAAAEGRPAAAVLAAPGVSLCTIDGPATPVPGIPGVPRVPRIADALIVQDPAELGRPGIFARLSPEAYLLVNSACGFGDLGVGEKVERFCRDRALILPAARLQTGLHDVAVHTSGLVGGFAALTRIVGLHSVISAIDRIGGGDAWACAEAAMAGYEFVQAEKRALVA
jgi:pyruvate ferredoxin oxidoreductase gamma subunit